MESELAVPGRGPAEVRLQQEIDGTPRLASFKGCWRKRPYKDGGRWRGATGTQQHSRSDSSGLTLLPSLGLRCKQG